MRRAGTRRALARAGRWSVASVFVLALHCGESERAAVDHRSPPTRVPDPTPTAEASALARAQCAYLERCDPDAMYLFAHESLSACEEFFACEAVGRLSRAFFSEPSALATCLDSLRTRECPDTQRQPFERFSAQGDFPLGPACGVPVPDLGPPPNAPSLGEPCLTEPEREVCAPGSYCVEADKPLIGTFHCGTCVQKLTLGESCTYRDRCEEGATCAGGDCRPVRDLGESCELDGECQLNRCESSICVSPYAPTPYADVVGGPCGDDAFHYCGNQLALYCDDGICRAYPDEGEPCTDVPAYRDCRLGQLCVDGRCFSVGCSTEVGEPCRGFCESGDCVKGVCTPVGGEGAPCEVSCGSIPCQDGRCGWTEEPRTMNGGACDFDHECESAFCERVVADYCEAGDCEIPGCDGCGTCTDRPTIESCE